jgi:hypothetical protein
MRCAVTECSKWRAVVRSATSRPIGDPRARRAPAGKDWGPRAIDDDSSHVSKRTKRAAGHGHGVVHDRQKLLGRRSPVRWRTRARGCRRKPHTGARRPDPLPCSAPPSLEREEAAWKREESIAPQRKLLGKVRSGRVVPHHCLFAVDDCCRTWKPAGRRAPRAHRRRHPGPRRWTPSVPVFLVGVAASSRQGRLVAVRLDLRRRLRAPT